MPVFCKQVAMAISQLLEQMRGSLDAGEEEGDCSSRKVTRGRCILLAFGCTSRRWNKEGSSSRFCIEGLFQGHSKVLYVCKTLLWVLLQGFHYDLLNGRGDCRHLCTQGRWMGR